MHIVLARCKTLGCFLTGAAPKNGIASHRCDMFSNHQIIICKSTPNLRVQLDPSGTKNKEKTLECIYDTL